MTALWLRLVGAITPHRSTVCALFDALDPLVEPELAAKMRVKAEPPRWPIKSMSLEQWLEKWGTA